MSFRRKYRLLDRPQDLASVPVRHCFPAVADSLRANPLAARIPGKPAAAGFFREHVSRRDPPEYYIQLVTMHGTFMVLRHHRCSSVATDSLKVGSIDFAFSESVASHPRQRLMAKHNELAVHWYEDVISGGSPAETMLSEESAAQATAAGSSCQRICIARSPPPAGKTG